MSLNMLLSTAPKVSHFPGSHIKNAKLNSRIKYVPCIAFKRGFGLYS